MASVTGPSNEANQINFVELDTERGNKFDQAVKQLGINILAAVPKGKESAYTSVLKDGKLSFITNQDYQKIQTIYKNTFPNSFSSDTIEIEMLKAAGGVLQGFKSFYNDLAKNPLTKANAIKTKDDFQSFQKEFNDQLWPQFQEISRYMNVIKLRLDEILVRPPPIKVPDSIENAIPIPTKPYEEIVPKNKNEAELFEFLQKLGSFIERQLRFIENEWAPDVDISDEMRRLKNSYNYLLEEKEKNWPPEFKTLIDETNQDLSKLFHAYKNIIGYDPTKIPFS